MTSRITCKIGDLCEQIRGVTYSKADAVTSPAPGYKPVLRANNITHWGLHCRDLVYVPESRISSRQHVKANDIVIAASSGSLEVVGKAARALADFDGGFGAFCKVLRPNGQVNPSYFAHFFQTRSYRRKISSLAAGANINNLRNEHLDNLDIVLPPLDEQRRIAAILDKAGALRAKRREAIAKLDQLLQSVFLDMFGDPISNPKKWEISTLGDECLELRNGYSIQQRSDASGVPISRIETISGGAVDMSRVGFADLKLEDVAHHLLQDGDILFSHINSTQHLCKCAIYLERYGPLVHGMNLLRLRAGPRIEPFYLLHLIKSDTYRVSLMRYENRAVNQSSIAAGKLKGHSIPVPPLEVQRRFVAIVERTKRALEVSSKAGAESDKLFHSIMHQTFSGAL